jgi:hypothetical protein
MLRLLKQKLHDKNIKYLTRSNDIRLGKFIEGTLGILYKGYYAGKWTKKFFKWWDRVTFLYIFQTFERKQLFYLCGLLAECYLSLTIINRKTNHKDDTVYFMHSVFPVF